MKEGRKLEYPEKPPDDELQKMHWWQSIKAHVLTITPRAAQLTIENNGDQYCCGGTVIICINWQCLI